MASDGQSVKIPAASLVHGSQAPKTVVIPNGGKNLPQNGKAVSEAAVKKPEPAPKSELQTQLALLNKFLNDSGRAAQFRPSQDEKLIQEVNPSTGEVVAEYSASEFAALARSVGISGVVVNKHV
jgi:hypothetical protein